MKKEIVCKDFTRLYGSFQDCVRSNENFTSDLLLLLRLYTKISAFFYLFLQKKIADYDPKNKLIISNCHSFIMFFF